MNAYKVLDLEERLDFSEEDLRVAFRDAGKRHHPDAGGGEAAFTEAREAFSLLSSPSKRLLHWLSLKGTGCETRGMISGGVMDLFVKVGDVSQKAEAVIRKREAARSTLARAMLEGSVQESVGEVETMIGELDAAILGECGSFGQWTKEPPDAGTASQAYRNLAFLEKWRHSLKALFGRMM